jgi:hypothetical protein
MFALAVSLAVLCGGILPLLQGRARQKALKWFAATTREPTNHWAYQGAVARLTLIVLVVELPVVALTLVPWVAISVCLSVRHRLVVLAAFAAAYILTGFAPHRGSDSGRSS